MNNKTPRETGLKMVEKGFITQEKFDEMVKEGLIAGEKFSRNYFFRNTDMNVYFPAVVVKPSRKAGANNEMTSDLKYVKILTCRKSHSSKSQVSNCPCICIQ